MDLSWSAHEERFRQEARILRQADSDRVVRVYFYAGAEPCDVLDSVKVDYGTNDLGIALFDGADPAAGNPTCGNDVMLKSVEITLDHDVEGRPFRDPARPIGTATDTTPDLGTVVATVIAFGAVKKLNVVAPITEPQRDGPERR